MTVSGNTQRQRVYRDRMRQLGLTQVLLTVPKDQAAEVKALAARMRAEHLGTSVEGQVDD